jgi:outer membrane protein
MGNSNFDPFVGVGLNYTKFFDESASGALKTTLQALKVTTASDDVDLKLKASWGLALQAGFNYKLSDNWGAHFAVSKMDIDTTGEVRVNDNVIQSVDVQIDPWVYMVGVRWSM